MSHWNTQLPIFMSLKSFPAISHTPVIAQLYDAVMVVVGLKLDIKCIVPTKYWTQYLWYANNYAIHLPTAAFFQDLLIYKLQGLQTSEMYCAFKGLNTYPNKPYLNYIFSLVYICISVNKNKNISSIKAVSIIQHIYLFLKMILQLYTWIFHVLEIRSL